MRSCRRVSKATILIAMMIFCWALSTRLSPLKPGLQLLVSLLECAATHSCYHYLDFTDRCIEVWEGTQLLQGQKSNDKGKTKTNSTLLSTSMILLVNLQLWNSFSLKLVKSARRKRSSLCMYWLAFYKWLVSFQNCREIILFLLENLLFCKAISRLKWFNLTLPFILLKQTTDKELISKICK